MTGLCYWCQNRSELQCTKCMRPFCKFCIKIDESKNEMNVLCLICCCFQITENESQEHNPETHVRSNFSDREVQDMLHRYEDMWNHNKLVNSSNDLLTGIDSWSSKDLALIFKLIKTNVFTMIQDMQKMEIMINEAERNGCVSEINDVLFPLLKVVTKHHAFQRWTLDRCLPPDELRSENLVDSVVEKLETVVQPDKSVVDLVDGLDTRSSEIEIDERMQRDPECLKDEEKGAENFIINVHDDDVDHTVKNESISTDQQTPFKPPLSDSTIGNSEKLTTKKRKWCRKTYEPRKFSLRSEKALESNKDSLHKYGTADTCSFNTLLSELTVASALLATRTKTMSESCDRGTTEPKPKKMRVSVGNNAPEADGFSQSFSSSDGNSSLNRFTKIDKREKNSHLVCPAPDYYERPFLLKEGVQRRMVSSDDLKSTVSQKVWSWERQPQSVKAVKISRLSNGAATVARPIILQTSMNSSLSAEPGAGFFVSSRISPGSTEGNLRQSTDSIKERSPNSEEPKKRRGRPRIYFNNSAQHLEGFHPTDSVNRISYSDE